MVRVEHQDVLYFGVTPSGIFSIVKRLPEFLAAMSFRVYGSRAIGQPC
jgi:hypothetical protein